MDGERKEKGRGMETTDIGSGWSRLQLAHRWLGTNFGHDLSREDGREMVVGGSKSRVKTSINHGIGSPSHLFWQKSSRGCDEKMGGERERESQGGESNLYIILSLLRIDYGDGTLLRGYEVAGGGHIPAFQADEVLKFWGLI